VGLPSTYVGLKVGEAVGVAVGLSEGCGVGLRGRYVGVSVGGAVGVLVGSCVGRGVGTATVMVVQVTSCALSVVSLDMVTFNEVIKLVKGSFVIVSTHLILFSSLSPMPEPCSHEISALISATASTSSV